MINESYILLPTQRDIATSAHAWRITELTICRQLKLYRLINADPVDVSAVLAAIRPYITAGNREDIAPAEAQEVISAIIDIASTKIFDSDGQLADNNDSLPFDLPLYREVAIVARFFGCLPSQIAHSMTIRQLHYAYYIAHNALADEFEQKVYLAGGKLKNKPKRLRLIGDVERVSTADMTPAQKAAYFSCQRRKEGRQPGRL